MSGPRRCNRPWGFRILHPSTRDAQPPWTPFLPSLCAVGGIHRSETTPLNRVASSLLTKGWGANEPRVPKILTATGTIDVILEEEARQSWKVIGHDLNFEKLTYLLKLHLYQPECSRSNLESK